MLISKSVSMFSMISKNQQVSKSIIDNSEEYSVDDCNPLLVNQGPIRIAEH